MMSFMRIIACPKDKPFDHQWHGQCDHCCYTFAMPDSNLKQSDKPCLQPDGSLELARDCTQCRKGRVFLVPDGSPRSYYEEDGTPKGNLASFSKTPFRAERRA